MEKEINKNLKNNQSFIVNDKHIFFRKIYNILFKTSIILFSIISIIPLFLILFYVLQKGITAIDWDFFVKLPKPVGVEGGGISNAIIGTFLLILMSSLMSVPLGVGTGIFLSEYQNSKLAYVVRLFVEVLQGVPSIVMGIIAYLWVVRPMGIFSGFSGAVALGMMMLPVIIKNTEETLKLIPHSLKEASMSLGVPYYKTILKVVLPSSISGIVTGVLIGIARIAGETAPLLFTAFGNPFMNLNIFKPMNSLSLLIFNYATSPYQDWHRIAWGASLFLIVFVLFTNLVANGVAKKWKVEF
ncbi:MAG: phosphate ABC transporter permease PstA [bacterium]